MEGVIFGTFAAEPLAGAPSREARRTTTSLTDHASARVNQPGIASVDEVMGEPERGNPLAEPVITGPDRDNTASTSTEPGLAVPAERADGTAAGQSLVGIVPPRASGGRDLTAEGVQSQSLPTGMDM
jgi:hypothetical protein